MNLGDVEYLERATLLNTDALIVVDLQKDFMPGGALPVPEGDSVVHGVNVLTEIFFKRNYRVIITQDWHPLNHGSFASAHPGKKPFDQYTEEEGLGPILWPDHCVQGSDGAQFHEDLKTQFAHLILRKGFHQQVDSYSAFLENDKKTETGLDGYLKNANIKRVFICGLALEFCDYYTACDAVEKDFEVVMVLDLTRGIESQPGSVSQALSAMSRLGIQFVKARDITIN